jgi:hypothetical protein
MSKAIHLQHYVDRYFDFIGSWQLIPEKSVYTEGVAPKSYILRIGVLHLEPLQLQFQQNWFTHDNQSYSTDFDVISDGSRNSFVHQDVASEVKLEVKDKSNFTYYGYNNDAEIWCAQYVINARGYLELTQKYLDENGKECEKFDVFHKQLSVLPYASSVSGVAIVPTNEGIIKHKALQAMSEQTDMNLLQIREQIELLAKQANEIQRRKELSFRIYESRINFVPQIGQTYHLYEKNDGKHLLSLVAPQEWGGSMPYKAFTASVRLLADHTWTEV